MGKSPLTAPPAWCRVGAWSSRFSKRQRDLPGSRIARASMTIDRAPGDGFKGRFLRA